MKISFINEKAKRGEYDLSIHAHNERQEEKVTVEDIEKILLKGAIITK